MFHREDSTIKKNVTKDLSISSSYMAIKPFLQNAKSLSQTECNCQSSSVVRQLQEQINELQLRLQLKEHPQSIHSTEEKELICDLYAEIENKKEERSFIENQYRQLQKQVLDLKTKLELIKQDQSKLISEVNHYKEENIILKLKLEESNNLALINKQNSSVNLSLQEELDYIKSENLKVLQQNDQQLQEIAALKQELERVLQEQQSRSSNYSVEPLEICDQNLSFEQKLKAQKADLSSFFNRFIQKKNKFAPKEEQRFFEDSAFFFRKLSTRNEDMIIDYDKFKKDYETKESEFQATMLHTLAHVKQLKESTDVSMKQMQEEIQAHKNQSELLLVKQEKLRQKKKNYKATAKSLPERLEQQKQKLKQRKQDIEKLSKALSEKEMELQLYKFGQVPQRNQDDTKHIEKIKVLKQELSSQQQTNNQMKRQFESEFRQHEIDFKKQIEEIKDRADRMKDQNRELNFQNECKNQQNDALKQDLQNKQLILQQSQDQIYKLQQSIQQLQQIPEQQRASANNQGCCHCSSEQLVKQGIELQRLKDQLDQNEKDKISLETEQKELQQKLENRQLMYDMIKMELQYSDQQREQERLELEQRLRIAEGENSHILQKLQNCEKTCLEQENQITYLSKIDSKFNLDGKGFAQEFQVLSFNYQQAQQKLKILTQEIVVLQADNENLYKQMIEMEQGLNYSQLDQNKHLCNRHNYITFNSSRSIHKKNISYGSNSADRIGVSSSRLPSSVARTRMFYQ